MQINVNILYFSPDFNYACGVSRYVFQCLRHFSEKDYLNVYFITNGGDSLARILENEKINLHLINFKKDHKNPFRLVKDFFQLLLYCKKYKIDLIHAHHRYTELISVLVSKIIAVKTVTTVHSYVYGLKSLSFRSDAIFCVSNTLRKNLIENYPHCKDRITVLYNCIDDTFFHTISDIETIRNKYGFNPDDKIILFAGRISKIKGVDTLISAFLKIIRSYENQKLILLGQVTDVYLLDAIKDFKKQILLIQPVSEVREFYQAANLVVLPSRSDSFPFVMLEAGIFKKAFIGGNTGGIAEFIEDGKNGLLVDPENPEQLAEKIIYLLSSPEIANNLGEKLNEKVTRMCNFNNYFSQVEKIYSSLIKSE